MRKLIAILFVVLFVVTMTASAVSAVDTTRNTRLTASAVSAKSADTSSSTHGTGMSTAALTLNTVKTNPTAAAILDQEPAKNMQISSSTSVSITAGRGQISDMFGYKREDR
jgi:hypothetical protein